MRRFLLLLLLAFAAIPSAVAAVAWGAALRQPAAWYSSEEARAIADSVLLYQTPSGGWPKNIDMAKRPALGASISTAATIDNGATHTQIRFLARVQSVQPDDRYLAAVERGVDYLLAAQYPNGGYPQYFPLRRGYYTQITFNDGAMTGALMALREIAAGQEPFAWLDEARRQRAAEAVERGIDCILKTQVVVKGRPTVWCAQHDEKTLQPAAARAFEPASLASAESAGVVHFLMSLDAPSPEVVAAVKAAVAWFEATKIMGLRWQTIDAPNQPGGRDRVAQKDPAAGPVWSRFYEIGTNRPIFVGRDGVVCYDVSEIEHERRMGYGWYGSAPNNALKAYPKWLERVSATAQ
jgi:PelA/Pel-15E family pectate lyase